MGKKLALLLLFAISLFTRFYRISQLSEFLGDQGRTGIIVHQTLAKGIPPLIGPPVLSGEHLGPFFYYLLDPSFIFSLFNPLGPAIFMGILGVLTISILFYITNKLFGFWIGVFTTFLYALSSEVLINSRQIWEPHAVPFFILLLLLSFYKIIEQKKPKYFLLTGISLSALVQLHYPNIFLVLFTLVLFVVLLKEKVVNRKYLKWIFIGIAGFFVVLSPFLLYESTHNFSDFRGLAQSVLSSQAISNIPPFRARFIDYSYRLFKYAIPAKELWQFPIIILAELIVIIFPFVKRKNNKWHIIFSAWFVTGLLFISLYKGITFNHYLNFLLPLPFLLISSFIYSIKNYVNKNLLIALCSILLIFQYKTLNLHENGNQDLQRVPSIANEMIIQSNNSPFSFTLLSSESFSDLHYRYFLLLNNKNPEKITNNNYNTLFLICEKDPCPTKDELSNKIEIQVFCFDEHCSGNYPKLSLKNWKLISSKQIQNGVLFTFKRNKS